MDNAIPLEITMLVQTSTANRQIQNALKMLSER